MNGRTMEMEKRMDGDGACDEKVESPDDYPGVELRRGAPCSWKEEQDCEFQMMYDAMCRAANRKRMTAITAALLL